MAQAAHIPPRIARAGMTGPGFTSIYLWAERAFRTARERRRLMALDERALKDIGVSGADAYREGSRPFWDLPPLR